ncbi:hypothetical protein HPP92_013309 [Vanilla planifolia]|uniref:VQ domain-containing protein n=1 Tax=Vanilla planifolia TaxID=51239 RepID=A0A835QYT2_VANPL|nr:hypothetical protein HPP92_013309 [Vanilla planifolia]
MEIIAQQQSDGFPRRGSQLQGPRPSPLKLHKNSHKILKPTPASPTKLQQSPPQRRRPPTIIYTVSPKVIHTEPSEFMSLVQRLTGWSTSSSDAASSCEASLSEAVEETASHAGEGTEFASGSPCDDEDYLLSPSVMDFMNSVNFFHPELSPGGFFFFP